MSNIPAAVQRHRDLVAELRAAYPELSQDELADTIEGQTDIDTVVASVVEEALVREAMAEGIAERIHELESRKSRLAVGAAKLREAALWAMSEAQLDKLARPGFTAYVGQSRRAVVITDETLIPRKYGKSTWRPDKTAIGYALKSGTEIEGATLSNSKPTLTVRTS